MKKYTVKLALFHDDGRVLRNTVVRSEEIEKLKIKGKSALDEALKKMLEELEDIKKI